MYLRVNNKKIEIKEMITFQEKLKSLKRKFSDIFIVRLFIFTTCILTF